MALRHLPFPHHLQSSLIIIDHPHLPISASSSSSSSLLTSTKPDRSFARSKKIQPPVQRSGRQRTEGEKGCGRANPRPF
ncbi:UNVERIFIED_CONTAM: hypothetical protein Sangu_2607000 [Sesamum angustifolium]|uniref:Uncharacterized protein n=1 Tax=Sesamum angustifolium TaxID=2727405 RepID=A0AAW2J5J1_9LAMI